MTLSVWSISWTDPNRVVQKRRKTHTPHYHAVKMLGMRRQGDSKECQRPSRIRITDRSSPERGWSIRGGTNGIPGSLFRRGFVSLTLEDAIHTS